MIAFQTVSSIHIDVSKIGSVCTRFSLLAFSILCTIDVFRMLKIEEVILENRKFQFLDQLLNNV